MQTRDGRQGGARALRVRASGGGAAAAAATAVATAVATPAVRVRTAAGKRPFLRCQMDVYKVKPPGVGGVCAALNVICVYSRFAYLRPLVVIDAKSVAEALTDVFLDMGVVPLVLQASEAWEVPQVLQVPELIQPVSSRKHWRRPEEEAEEEEAAWPREQPPVSKVPLEPRGPQCRQ